MPDTNLHERRMEPKTASRYWQETGVRGATDLQYSRVVEGTKAYSLSDLFGLPSASRQKTRKETHPGGCEWFSDCDLCMWEDCESDGRGGYGTAAGRSARKALAEAMTALGASDGEVHAFLGDRGDMPKGRAAEAIRRRQEGEGEAVVARGMGVSARTVRYWCAGAGGIKRHSGSGAHVGGSLAQRALVQARKAYLATFSPIRTQAADNERL